MSVSLACSHGVAWDKKKTKKLILVAKLIGDPRGRRARKQKLG